MDNVLSVFYMELIIDVVFVLNDVIVLGVVFFLKGVGYGLIECLMFIIIG